ncbi:MAG: ATP-binding cassette domain-containing protein [Crocinitomicaceae bacterium]|jgi:ABC-2 type transport system ATP-binding protein|nr:ATP-binding cassette domain-containing protein [Crocinitomicaceae bacterium]MCF8411636.1 ATP-binding cassette domain-containing protein [Crocinitomicaceae bacterium]MCF8444669.1 ATP-binding cassette domain-containing protein [Crocinitomicaceae bacterium]
MENILEVRNLSKRFGKINAVNSISFSVEKGNVYGLLGPNGSGKSTTLGILLSTINPTEGSWSWFGQPGTPTDVLKRIGAIIEHPNFYTFLSAEKNLKIVCEIKNVNYDRINEVLQLVGLAERKNDKFSTFSLGMKQRLSIASAMLSSPEVLILDEPTNGLDPEGIIQIREIIRSIAAQGTTILLASHLLDEVEKVCSHVIILKKGVSLYCGKVSAMTATKGYFILQSSNMTELKHELEKMREFNEIKTEDNKLIASIEHDITAEKLNKHLLSKEIYLSHLVKQKESLEEQFLELVKQNQ